MDSKLIKVQRLYFDFEFIYSNAVLLLVSDDNVPMIC
jgi:hypothetical protein